MEMGLRTVCLADAHRSAPCTTFAVPLCPRHTDTVKLCSWFTSVNRSELGATLTTPGGKSTRRLADVPRRAAHHHHRLIGRGVPRRREHDRDGRVVQREVGDHRDGGAVHRAPRDHGHVLARVDAAEEADVVAGVDVTRPGSTALPGSTWPAPVAKKSAGRWCSLRIAFPERSIGSAVVMIADLIAAGDQSGCLLLISAATPLRCGVDMDVPEAKKKVGSELMGDDDRGPTWNGHAASTLTPGPVTSGFRTPGLCTLGPREENQAIAGAGEVPSTVPWKTICATGLAVELM
ncbi:LOW QUALITY PROTEIN: hypothetical protein U9M48_032249 [Paspalum notatum var. saurae]|uniref:Uncharacterized protein n=1 Tax=Paspalum notatum var. saurae TaxID=547442 RepID=A0AAQ3U4B0_PASNO